MDLEQTKARLIAGALRDREVRTRLAQSGALFDGYHPEMESVHLENARMLEGAIAAHGWPDRKRFGDDGAAAAFVILQHAISRPDLQRRCLSLIADAAARGEANVIDAAMLADRIAVFEGRPQRFGTQFDWDSAGLISPARLLDPDGVDQRRAEIGLPPMAEAIAEMRARVAADGERAPPDHDQRRASFEAWAKKTGWRA